MSMVKQVFSNIYRLEIPLPDSPLRSLNSYVITGSHRNLIIDTGLNRPECKQAMEEGLQQLGIDLNVTDIFLTHFHADHSGLISYFASPNSVVYGSLEDTNVIKGIMESKGQSYWQNYVRFAEINGFLDAGSVVASHPGIKYMKDNDSSAINWLAVKDGDEINIGDYHFTCLATPGHTAGHFCLYEKEFKLLFAGDHIMSKISPNIELFADDINPLWDYLESLQIVRNLDIDVVFPAHRFTIYNHRYRIDELIQHHRERGEEILSIMQNLPQQTADAFRIASFIKWDIKYDDWDDFPPAQKWFATGECIAHLRYLEQNGQLKKICNNDAIKYSLP
ncbi:MBL fold metallo-hydrolase [Syntrophomonas curvata]